MLETSTNFDTKNALAYKTPLYLIHFDGESVDYCNHKPTSPSNTLKQYLQSISGISQRIVPEEGRASISGISAAILDYNDEITALLATDSYYFHRKKTTVKAGYAGMAEADLVTLMTGWVTNYELGRDGLVYAFELTDPQKWMQRKIFREAEDATVTISGNPLNILLQILCSTGNGTNGDYDVYAEENGLGILTDFINVSNIETIRDDWFPADSHYMKFTINKRVKAKDFFEQEIFKTLNLYPVIDGDGKFNLKPFKPPFPASDVQSFDEDNIIGLPRWSANLEGVYNEVEFYYNWDPDDEEYLAQDFYVHSTSLNNRGPGKSAIEIKTKGWHSTISNTSDIMTRRKNKIFARYATPPLKLNIETFFSRFLSEAGDIVPVTHSKLPDIEAGTRGLTAARMEIINRTIDWKKGRVKFELLDTGFDQGDYMLISPSMTVTSGTNQTVFDVSAADAAKYEEGWIVDIFDAGMHIQASVQTITDITGTQITVSPGIGATPAAGWIVQFSSYASLAADQQNWWAINEVGVSSFEFLIAA